MTELIDKEKLKGNCKYEKMSKAIEENNLIVTIKIFLWEFNLHWKLCVQAKTMIGTKRIYPSLFHSHYSCFKC